MEEFLDTLYILRKYLMLLIGVILTLVFQSLKEKMRPFLEVIKIFMYFYNM